MKLFFWVLMAVGSCLSMVGMAQAAASSASAKNALDFTVKDINGKELNLSQYLGEVVLIVNTASQCGYTPQYEGLQAVYKTYADQGFQVIGFPCNNFGGQEPGTHEEILAFCKKNYGVTFPMMAKVEVQGDNQAALYKHLTADPKHGGAIRWNFEKFLIDRKGNVAGHYRSGVRPDSAELTKAIEAELKKDK